jgi:hypothetical protein
MLWSASVVEDHGLVQLPMWEYVCVIDVSVISQPVVRLKSRANPKMGRILLPVLPACQHRCRHSLNDTIFSSSCMIRCIWLGNITLCSRPNLPSGQSFGHSGIDDVWNPLSRNNYVDRPALRTVPSVGRREEYLFTNSFLPTLNVPCMRSLCSSRSASKEVC